MDQREAERLYDSGKKPTVAKLLEMDNEIRRLKDKMASLSTNSTNSSKPPSSDGPEVNKEKKKKSPRKPGGQKGHEGKKRTLLPVEQMDHVHELYPSACEHCGKSFDAGSAPESKDPLRHQVFELPQIEPIKTEYRCHELVCSCGHATRAQLPTEVSSSSFGPRVHAAIGYLSCAHKGTRRGIVEIMSTLFKLDISLGATCNAAQRVSNACEPVSDEIREHAKEAQRLNSDETGWKSKGERRWLWVFVTPLVVFFKLSSSRASKVLKSVLGDKFSGILISDDHSAYSAYHRDGIRQLCWAHIIRKLKGLKESGSSPDAYLFSKTLLKEVGRLFTYWHAYRRIGFAHEKLWSATALIRARIKKSCLHYQNSADKCVQTRAKQLLKNWDHLFTFLRYEAVEPTNNAAERALRPAVQWRKICFGNQSFEGERFTERILTVTRTCQVQGNNPFEFLCELMSAYFKGESPPSLIPKT